MPPTNGIDHSRLALSFEYVLMILNGKRFDTDTFDTRFSWRLQLSAIKQASSVLRDAAGYGGDPVDPWRELMNLGLDIAVVTSVANSLVAGAPCLLGSQALVIYAPRIGQIERLEAAAAQSPIPTEGFKAALRALAGHMASALRLGQEAAAHLEPSEEQYIPVAEAWRRAANVAYVAHWLAARTLPADLAVQSISRTDITRLRALLRTSSQGGWPALDTEGRLAAALVADRRKHPRRPLEIDIRILIRDVWHDVRTFDVSSGGFGIESVPSLASGDAVAISLPDGTLAQARVVWARDGRAGVLFTNPLTFPNLAQWLDGI